MTISDHALKYGGRFSALLFGMIFLATACGQSTPFDEPLAETFDPQDWDSVLAAADGTTVRWHMWGGNDNLNSFVDEVYGPRLKELGVDLERVPLNDTADAVTQIIAETEAGEEDGSLDLIWINGANSATLADQGLLYEGWSRSLPNAAFVDFENKWVASDFGRDIGAAQSPWASAQTQLVYDSAKVNEGNLPSSYEEFATYACDNPGRVTYVDPNNFHGARFLNGALYELAGETEKFSAFGEEVWAEESAVLWDWLNEWESCLWREGKTYPEDDAALHNLLANGEVDFSITLAVGGAAPQIEDKTLPETARAFTFNEWMVRDSSYVAIPSNASNPAGAIVLADMLLEPALQAQQMAPESGGSGLAIDVSLVTEESDKAVLGKAIENLPEGAVSPDRLDESVAPVAAGDYETLLGEDWRPNVVAK